MGWGRAVNRRTETPARLTQVARLAALRPLPSKQPVAPTVSASPAHGPRAEAGVQLVRGSEREALAPGGPTVGGSGLPAGSAGSGSRGLTRAEMSCNAHVSLRSPHTGQGRGAPDPTALRPCVETAAGPGQDGRQHPGGGVQEGGCSRGAVATDATQGRDILGTSPVIAGG